MESMHTDIHHHHGFTTPLRVLFGLIAVAALFGSLMGGAGQWVAFTGYAGSIMWGVMAVFGGKAGWRRYLTWAAVIVYVVLIVGRPLGLAI